MTVAGGFSGKEGVGVAVGTVAAGVASSAGVGVIKAVAGGVACRVGLAVVSSSTVVVPKIRPDLLTAWKPSTAVTATITTPTTISGFVQKLLLEISDEKVLDIGFIKITY